MNINDILNGTKHINNLSNVEYISIISELINNYKYQLHKNRDITEMEKKINELNALVIQSNIINDSLKTINVNLNKILSEDLSIKERLLGKIDLKSRLSK